MKDILTLSDNEAVIIKCLNKEPLHIDLICRKADLSAAETSAALSMMELKGLVKQAGVM